MPYFCIYKKRLFIANILIQHIAKCQSEINLNGMQPYSIYPTYGIDRYDKLNSPEGLSTLLKLRAAYSNPSGPKNCDTDDSSKSKGGNEEASGNSENSKSSNEKTCENKQESTTESGQAPKSGSQSGSPSGTQSGPQSNQAFPQGSEKNENPTNANNKQTELHNLVQQLYMAQAQVQLEANEIQRAQSVALSAQQSLEIAANHVRSITAALQTAQQDVAAAAMRAQTAQLQLAAHDQLLFAARQKVDALSSQMVGLQAQEGIVQSQLSVDIPALLNKLKQPLPSNLKPSPIPSVLDHCKTRRNSRENSQYEPTIDMQKHRRNQDVDYDYANQMYESNGYY